MHLEWNINMRQTCTDKYALAVQMQSLLDAESANIYQSTTYVLIIAT